MNGAAAALALAQMGIEVLQLIQSGNLTDAQAQQVLQQSGINVDAAVAAWQTAKARWAQAPQP